MFPQTNIKSIKQNEKNFTLYTVEFENAIFGFFFEGENRKVGTIAIAIPNTSLTISSSSVLLGYKNASITRLLAEYLASKFNKIAISSVFIYLENDVHTNRTLLKLAQSIIGV